MNFRVFVMFKVFMNFFFVSHCLSVFILLLIRILFFPFILVDLFVAVIDLFGSFRLMTGGCSSESIHFIKIVNRNYLFWIWIDTGCMAICVFVLFLIVILRIVLGFLSHVYFLCLFIIVRKATMRGTWCKFWSCAHY